MKRWLQGLSVIEQAVIVLSLLTAGFFLIDPFVLERAKALPSGVVDVLRTITNIGTSAWMLIPTGSVIALALVLRRLHLGLRNAAGYGLIISTIGYVFVSVGGAGLIANVAKNIIGRARPKLFGMVGPLDFKPFAFNADFASFPSGHATNIFALATVLAILWPRGRVLLYTIAIWIAATRPLIGAHYFTDVVAGAVLGIAFPYWVRDRFAARRWLFERSTDGGYRLRGPRVQRWLGWPGTISGRSSPQRLQAPGSGRGDDRDQNDEASP